MSEISDNDRERDAGLTAIYRAAAPDEPPVTLDAAILAAARREVGARPRPAGFSFVSSWRTSLSMAAVLVLSVSLVTLMREEAPELTEAPRADMPAAESKLKALPGADKVVPVESGSVREEHRSKNIGLKPSQPGSPSGLGMRQPEIMAGVSQSKKDALADKAEADATGPVNLAKRRVELTAAADLRDKKAAVATEQQRQAAKTIETREFARAPASPPSRTEAAKAEESPVPGAPSAPGGTAAAGRMTENKAQAGQEAARNRRADAESRMPAQAEYAPARPAVEAPAAVAAARPATPFPAPIAETPPASRPSPSPMLAPPARSAPPLVGALGKFERADDLGAAPEKWLERIMELRKQGRFDEAKASLAEFRKRYPAYRLPDSLRDWVQP